MIKRFPALILSLALLLCLPARAAGPRLEAHLPESPVKAGDEFTVTVDLTGNPGILHIQFTLTFDRERMECADIELGEALQADSSTEQALSSVNPNGAQGAVLAAISLNPMTKDGPVGIFHFKAKENLSDFHFSIEKIYLGNDKIEKYDVTVTTAQPSGNTDLGTTESASGVSDAPKSDGGTDASDAPKSNGGGTSASDAPKSDGGGTSASDAPKSNSGGTSASDAPKSDGGTSVSDAPKSDGGTDASDAPKSDGGTSVSDAPKSDGGTNVSDAPKNNGGGTDASDTPKSDGGASVSDAPKSDGDTQKSGGADDAGQTEDAESGTEKPLTNENASPPFTDIAGTWAETYIRTAAERNLFQGYADGTFRPNNRLTRAQFMMVLWNLAGRPEASKDSPFEDMDGQIENFRKAVAWAYAKGLVNGTSATTFSPGEPLTRQAAMKILFAYHGGKRGAEVLLTDAYDSIYTDSGQISAWAKSAMYWAVYQTILSGSTPSTLNPGGIVTRAQLASMMVRYTDRFPS